LPPEGRLVQRGAAVLEALAVGQHVGAEVAVGPNGPIPDPDASAWRA
jgi:hypothetical protein